MRRPPARVLAVMIAGVIGCFVWVMAAIWDIVDGQSVIKTHEAIRRRVAFAVECARRMFTVEGIDMVYIWSKSLDSRK